MFAKTLLVIVLIGTVMGLVGVWYPEFYKHKVAERLVWSFIVISIGVAVATSVLQYIPQNK